MFCSVVLAVVFAIAAFSKVRSRVAFESFRQTLPGFGLSRRWSMVVAPALVVAEVATVAVLFVAPCLGFAIAAGLLLAFSAGIAVALRRRQPTTCRCFGASNTVVGPEHLVRNALLVGVAVVGASSELALPASSPDQAIRIVAAALGVLAGLLVTRWDDLLFIVRGARSNS